MLKTLNCQHYIINAKVCSLHKVKILHTTSSISSLHVENIWKFLENKIKKCGVKNKSAVVAGGVY